MHGGQVQHALGTHLGEHPGRGRTIPDVHLEEARIGHLRQGAAAEGEVVEHEDRMAFGRKMGTEGGADEARTTGDEHALLLFHGAPRKYGSKGERFSRNTGRRTIKPLNPPIPSARPDTHPRTPPW